MSCCDSRCFHTASFINSPIGLPNLGSYPWAAAIANAFIQLSSWCWSDPPPPVPSGIPGVYPSCEGPLKEVQKKKSKIEEDHQKKSKKKRSGFTMLANSPSGSCQSPQVLLSQCRQSDKHDGSCLEAILSWSSRWRLLLRMPAGEVTQAITYHAKCTSWCCLYYRCGTLSY